jgi:hypothetical protein
MKIKKIEYLLAPADLLNDCLDVFVTLEDEYCENEFFYCVEITTPQFLSTLMEGFESDFLPPDYPYIIVSKLTDDIIEASIKSFVNTRDDSYWLKLYHITTTLQTEDVNDILHQKKQETIESDAKWDAEWDAKNT